METAIAVLITVQTFQTVYLFFIVKKQDELIDTHNDFVEATITCITELADDVDEINQTLEETE